MKVATPLLNGRGPFVATPFAAMGLIRSHDRQER